MADTIEKIYCSDRGDDNALTADAIGKAIKLDWEKFV